MKRQFFVVLTLVVLASLLLTACGGGSKPAVQTEGLKEEAFAPTKVEAPNCDYGGEIKSIEAVDERVF